jgi:hypothetical protein
MFKFEMLENETLKSMFRQTEAVLLRPVLAVFVSIYLPWYFLIKYEMAGQYKGYLLIWTVVVFLYAVYKYLLWLLNVNLLTSQRLICVNYRNLAAKDIVECQLDKIASLSVSTTGIVSTLFGFGDVAAYIMNTDQQVVLKNVRDPVKVKNQIWSLCQGNAQINMTKISQKDAQKPKIV